MVKLGKNLLTSADDLDPWEILDAVMESSIEAFSTDVGHSNTTHETVWFSLRSCSLGRSYRILLVIR